MRSSNVKIVTFSKPVYAKYCRNSLLEKLISQDMNLFAQYDVTGIQRIQFNCNKESTLIFYI